MTEFKKVEEVSQTAQISRFLYAKSAHMRHPVSGTFELTPRCNMNCRMCYIRMTEEEMRTRGREITAREWIDMGKQCVDAGLLFLLFTGGEPFLRKDFKEIYTEIAKMGVLPSINSNGTMINKENTIWLSKNCPTRVNVTLYGGSNETYGRLCRNPKGFDQATEGILRLQDAGIPVSLNASFTRDNARDMDAIYEFATRHDLKVRATSYMFPPMRSAKEGAIDADMANVRFSPEEAGEMMARALQCKLGPEAYCKAVEAARNGKIEFPDVDEDCGRSPEEQMGCSAGKSAFWITWDGRMTPCGMMNIPEVHPFETGFANAWEKLYHETDKIFLPPACKECTIRESCMVCGAVALAEGEGDTSRKPEYLCRMTEAYLKTLMQG